MARRSKPLLNASAADQAGVEVMVPAADGGDAILDESPGRQPTSAGDGNDQLPPANDDEAIAPTTGAAIDRVPSATGDGSSRPESSIGTRAALVALGRALRTDVAKIAAAAKPRVKAAGGKLVRKAAQVTRKIMTRDYSRLRPSGLRSDLVTPAGGPAPALAAKPRKRPRWARLLALTAAAAGILVLGCLATVVWALHDIPLDKIVSGTAEPIVVLAAANGQPLVQQGPFQDVAIPREQYPDHLVQAVLSIEDRRFYHHWGVDFWAVLRASTRNLFAGQVVEGGSTITQQLVKVLHLEGARTVRRKIQEVLLSLWLESSLSKDEILARYLNSVYLGAGATGVSAAARIYFDKAVSELTLAESAMLAGLIAAPSAFNPLETLDGARERTAVVLNAMGSAGYLDESAILEAQLNPAQLKPSRPALGAGTWFADWAMREAHEIAGPFRGSLKVTTTIVPALQALAEQTIAELIDADAIAKGASQAALVALSPDGAVVAMVGGLDYQTSQFNRAVDALRQPGSTFKLFVYYAALKAGISPDAAVDDEPVDVDGWQPENFDGKYFGHVSLAEAFARSLNAATVRVGMTVGIDAVITAARELGIDASLDETPSVLLGASEITLLDLTGAFASVRAGVAPIEPWGLATLEAESGKAFRIGPTVEPGVSLDQQDVLVALLQLVVDKGTGQAAALDGFAAGKTGTSQDYRDAWFVGFNEKLTVGVWVGNDEGKPMEAITGGQLPALIWQRFMSAATQPADPAPLEMDAVEANVSARPEPLQCDVRACSRFYRSFRASDCSYQPYGGGPRKICER